MPPQETRGAEGGRGGRRGGGGGGRRDEHRNYNETVDQGEFPPIVQKILDATLDASDTQCESALRRLTRRGDDEISLYQNVYDDLMAAPTTKKKAATSVESLTPRRIDRSIDHLRVEAALIQTGGRSGLRGNFDTGDLRNLTAGEKHEYYSFGQVTSSESCKLVQETFSSSWSTNVEKNKEIVLYAFENNQLLSVKQHFPLRAKDNDTHPAHTGRSSNAFSNIMSLEHPVAVLSPESLEFRATMIQSWPYSAPSKPVKDVPPGMPTPQDEDNIYTRNFNPKQNSRAQTASALFDYALPMRLYHTGGAARIPACIEDQSVELLKRLVRENLESTLAPQVQSKNAMTLSQAEAERERMQVELKHMDEMIRSLRKDEAPKATTSITTSKEDSYGGAGVQENYATASSSTNPPLPPPPTTSSAIYSIQRRR